MSKFLMQVSFTREGTRGLTEEGGTKRRQKVEQFFGSVGGKLEALYFAFGETDVFAIVDFPDNVSAAAISLAANSTGAVHAKATVLITPEEMDPEIDAASTVTPEPAVLVNLVGGAEQWWRTRMTLAHELCHLLLDRERSGEPRFVMLSPTSERRASTLPGLL